jgi:hypothetical protein
VSRTNLNVALENDVLRVDGQIDFSKYEGMEPVYTEYNIGHYTRSFTLSNKMVLRCLAWVATISVWKHEIEFGCEQVNHGFEVAD